MKEIPREILPISDTYFWMKRITFHELMMTRLDLAVLNSYLSELNYMNSNLSKKWGCGYLCQAGHF